MSYFTLLLLIDSFYDRYDPETALDKARSQINAAFDMGDIDVDDFADAREYNRKIFLSLYK